MSTIYNCINQTSQDNMEFITSKITTVMKFHNAYEVHELFRDDYHKNGVSENFGIIEISVEEMPIKKCTWDILFSIDISASMSERCRDGKSKLHHIKHTMSNILLLFSKNTDAVFNVCVHAFNDKHKEIFDFVEITADNVEKYIQFIKYIRDDGSTDLLIPLEMCEKKYEERQETHPDNKFVHIELTDGEDTSNNTNQTLVSHVTDNHKNIFIGFGTEHNSELLEMFTTNTNNEYRFIDKIDNSGYVYGEIIHNLLYTFVDNARISVLNGLIYDWKTNEWTNNIDIGSIATGSTKTFHIKTTTPNLMTGKFSDNVTGNILSYMEKSPEGFVEPLENRRFSDQASAAKQNLDSTPRISCGNPMLNETTDISGNSMMNIEDLTKYMFRQKVQELIYMAKKTEDTYVHKKTLKEFFLSMKVYVETNQHNDDIFWKVLLDDIYIVYKTMGKSYAHMYTTTRQVSQGREYSCNTDDTFDDDNNNHMVQRPMLFRQTNRPYTNDMFTQPDNDDEFMEKYFGVKRTESLRDSKRFLDSTSRISCGNPVLNTQKSQGIDDSIDATINYNDMFDNDDDDDDILNHQVTLTRETTTNSTQQMNDIIDFIRNQDMV